MQTPTRLAGLIGALGPAARVTGAPDVSISGLTIDSRLVKPGDLFVALPGLQSDGVRFAGDALAAGARAVLAGAPPPDDLIPLPDGTAWVQVEAPRTALAAVAAAFYGHPSRDLTLIGVTGTNGKTTVCYLLESIFRAAGLVPGALGTVSVRFAGQEHPAALTTPEAHELQRTLREMVAAGVTHVAMEVSSHAIEQRRSAHTRFAAGVFTNLSRDHLDYHGDLEGYAAAKRRLFTEDLPASGAKGAAINLDDPVGRDFRAACGVPVLGFSLGGDPDGARDAAVRTEDLRCTIDGGAMRLMTPRGPLSLTTPLLGRHNVENVVAAATTCEILGLPHEAIRAGVAALAVVPGRLERVPNPGGAALLVDYAHTDDALANVTRALAPLTKGRLITVFGCGGDRDRTKRPIMGAVAMEQSDLAVVTSDNPRTEPPDTIIADILPGVRKTGAPELSPAGLAAAARGFVVEVDRRRAIELAFAAAQPDDTILVAGKGHEDYQIVGRVKHHFDDREVLREAIAERVSRG